MLNLRTFHFVVYFLKKVVIPPNRTDIKFPFSRQESPVVPAFKNQQHISLWSVRRASERTISDWEVYSLEHWNFRYFKSDRHYYVNQFNTFHADSRLSKVPLICPFPTDRWVKGLFIHHPSPFKSTFFLLRVQVTHAEFYRLKWFRDTFFFTLP